MRLTDTKIREATLIEGRRYRVLGDGRGGYGLRLVIQRGKSGAITKSFTQRLSVDGKQTDIGIGNYPLIGLDDARAIAILNARQVRLSRPSALDRMLAPTLAIAPAPAAPAPVLAIAPSDDMPTFGEAYERNIQLRLTAWQTNARGRSSSEMQWRSKYKNYLAGALGDMPVNEITSRTMQEILEPLWTAKPSVAEDICSYANHVFEWAQGMEYINSNPVIKAKKALGGKPRKNGRIHHEAIAHVSASQFYAGISAVSGMATAKNALRFLILTAARKEEVLAAKWGKLIFRLRRGLSQAGAAGA